MPLLGRGCNALLALLFMLSGLPQGIAVVCVTQDGHVALEIAGAARSAGTAPVSQGTSLRDAACVCGDGCGPCRDSEVGVVSAAALPTAARVRAMAASVLLPATASGPAPATLASPPQAAHPARSPSSWSEFQRSVVLRV